MPSQAVDEQALVDAICCELSERLLELAETRIRTLYFGGGTPSLLNPRGIKQIVEALYQEAHRHQITIDIQEFTIEVNPDDVTEERCTEWQEIGVNRVSMGVQSWNDDELRKVGRRHTAAAARKAYNILRLYFSNVSLDLIFGLPGQTLESWEQNVKETVALHPEHISAYSLMFEEGTALTKLRDKGKISEPSEELSLRMFNSLIDRLKAAGYEHYEISNFALPGYRSKHNSSYWQALPYLGLGPAAGSYDGHRIRRMNHASINEYLKRYQHRDATEIADIEMLTDSELLEEYILVRMRMKEGIPFDDFEKRFGKGCLSILMDAIGSMPDSGLIRLSESSVSLSAKGVMLSDNIILYLSDFF